MAPFANILNLTAILHSAMIGLTTLPFRNETVVVNVRHIVKDKIDIIKQHNEVLSYGTIAGRLDIIYQLSLDRFFIK